MRRLIFALSCIAAMGQSYEIRGLVQELGSNAPVAGAEVTVKEFVVIDGLVTPKVIAKILTNPRGEYVFHPEHEANFYLEARKDGYEDATSRGQEDRPASAEAAVSLTSERPSEAIAPLLLIRPSEIFGKVVDGEGKARAGLRFRLYQAGSRGMIEATTDRNGEFRVGNLQPGQYLIRVTAANFGFPEPAPFSEAEFEKVDEGVEWGYWPGGVNDPSQTAPFVVDAGSRVNAGTLVVRTVKYPRVHVSLDGDCNGAVWGYTFTTPATINDPIGWATMPCRSELLFKFVPPGGGSLHMADLRSKRWGEAEVRVDDHPSVVHLSEPLSVPVRITAVEGLSLASLGKLRIGVRPAQRALPFGNSVTVDAETAGSAALPQVPWSDQNIMIEPLQEGTYVKSLHYYGNPLNGPVLKAIPGAALEIELDNNAPTLKGMVKRDGNARVFVVRWPTADDIYVEAAPPFRYLQTVNQEDTYSIQLAPGEYRAIALDERRLPAISSTELRDLLAAGERVVIERGQEKTLDLKLAAR